MHQYPPPPPGYGNYQYPPPPFGGPAGFRPPPQHISPPQGFQYPNYPLGMPPPRGYNGPSLSLDQQQPQQQPQQQQPPPPPLQVQQSAAPPSPVQETKPDVAIALAPPPTVKPAPIQPTPKPAGVVPAMPIPISIPVQPRPMKPTPQQQPTTSPPTTSPQPVVTDTAKVATAADVQSLAKNLSETKLSSSTTNNVPGAGGYLTQPRRRQFASGANGPKMDQDYDFESANAKFNKEEIAKEVAAQSTTATGADDPTTEGPSTAQLAAALAEESFYDKGKSFFDNISCENKDRSAVHATQDGTVNPNSWKRGEERKLNIETFGQASIDYGGGRYGRGGYRGGRGGGYRGGRGGGGGGYYGRGRGSGNPWRGGGPRANGSNGQNSSERTTA